MRILVTVKSVPDPDRLDSSTAQAALTSSAVDGVPYVPNDYDLRAVTAALAVGAEYDIPVAAVSVGPRRAIEVLRYAIAMGCDDAILVESDWVHGQDAALALHALTERLGDVALVICGRQASDTDAGEVPHRLGVLMGVPSVGPITLIESLTASHVVALSPDGRFIERIEVSLPCVLAIAGEGAEPDVPPIARRIMAGRATVDTMSAVDLGVGPSEPSWAVRDVCPRSTRTAEMVGTGQGDEQSGRMLADRLLAEGLV